MELLAEEAGRPAHSLATVLFMGRDEFVSRMRGRFRLRDQSVPQVESHDLGGGVKALALRKSRMSSGSTAKL